MHSFQKIVFLLVSVFAMNAAGTETCQLERLKEIPADSARCYFYSGTTAFRAEDYAKAAMYWKRLVSLKSLPIEEEHLKTDAYNNLGYLYFFGYGVKADKPIAIQYWNYAMKSGNEEAAYHLCHVYAEPKEPTYDPKVALGYCKEGLRRYNLLEERDEQLDDIVDQLQAYIQKLEQSTAQSTSSGK